MKTHNKPATSKLTARYDKELKNILLNDLKALRAKSFLNIINGSQLAA